MSVRIALSGLRSTDSPFFFLRLRIYCICTFSNFISTKACCSRYIVICPLVPNPYSSFYVFVLGTYICLFCLGDWRGWQKDRRRKGLNDFRKRLRPKAEKREGTLLIEFQVACVSRMLQDRGTTETDEWIGCTCTRL